MKTKLDASNSHHKMLIATMAKFVSDFGYSTRELYDLMDHSKMQMWSALLELEDENKAKSKTGKE